MTGSRGRWLDDEGAVPRTGRFRFDILRPIYDDEPPPRNPAASWLDTAEEPPDARNRVPSLRARYLRPVSGAWLDEPDEVPGDGAGGAGPGGPVARPQSTVAPQWTSFAFAIGGILLFVGCILAVTGNTNIAGGLVVIPVLYAIAHTIAHRLAEHDENPAVATILMAGFAVKMAGVALRYLVSIQVYGRSDATEYALWGRQIARGLRSFEVIDIGRLTGTNFIRFVTGVVFAVTPGTIFTGFVVFGFFSYIGMIFFWRAYRIAVSDQSDLRYLQVLMILPSLVFWPSALGKDAWTVMGMGIACYGAACIIANLTTRGWLCVALGATIIGQVRPHVALPLIVGILLAELFRSRGAQGAVRAAASLGFLFVFATLAIGAATTFLGVDDLGQATIQQELDNVASRTEAGGSEFEPTPVHSPVQFPMAALTVLFRPMPFEASSPQEFISALENVALLGMFVFSIGKVAAELARPRTRGYVLFCVGVITAFVVAYSSFSNFALIARQRTQVTALLLVFLCIPRSELVVDAPKVRAGPAPGPPVPDEG